MVFIDTSVALAHLLGEGRRPPDSFWAEQLVASRLLEYELWNRIHTLGPDVERATAARELVQRIAFVELSRSVLARALDRFPVQIRTLDALHVTSCAHLRETVSNLTLATYDERMRTAARALKIPLADV